MLVTWHRFYPLVFIWLCFPNAYCLTRLPLPVLCCAKPSPGVVSAAVGGLSLQNGFGGFDDSGGEVGADFSGVGEQWIVCLLA